ncbi:MAG: CoA-binding protein [Candidatus Aenigmatarchaeota archaeon]|nr:MAG: CoA-binding protein [Candidatus Aenigmarchaeota archaeon]
MYEEFLNKKNRIAVVGASRNKEKWGYRVFRKLKDLGFIVFPVNPGVNEIEGERCYADLGSLPEKPDLVITVVKPEITEKVVEECRGAGVRRVWMQPGSESRKAVLYCKNNGIEVVYDSCYVVDGLKTDW